MKHEIIIHRVFAAAHALRLPDGSHEPVHGHNWDVRVTVGRDDLDAMQTVMDFHDLERALDAILAPFHNQDLNQHRPFADGLVNPTAEQVAWWIGEQTAMQLPPQVRLLSVHVGEAPGCTAVYRPA